MSTNVEGGSAKIYQFPARGRFAMSSQPNESSTKLAELLAPKIVFGSGWYHDAAIQDERTRLS